jgi:glycerol-1-phosphate dehydrogenase [NAD(P)+]
MHRAAPNAPGSDVNERDSLQQDAALQRALERATVTRSVDVDVGALERLPASIAALARGRRVVIVADPNTMAAAGERARAALTAARFDVQAPIVLDESPRVKPRAAVAKRLGEQMREGSLLPLAVGSGVVNDVTKYAAQIAGTAYVCVATAASMDGYAASGAALLDDGFKRTLDCAPPVAIVADPDVIANAPARMASWGYGDLSGKLVAGLDWILADALGEDAIAPEPFGMVQDHLGHWLAGYAQIAQARRGALRDLMIGLLVSGFAMQAHGSSRPASGSDHQFAHVWEMEQLAVDGEPAAHGACVGIGAIAMLAMYEWFVAQDVASRATACEQRSDLDASAVDAEIDAAFEHASVRENARREMHVKRAALARRSSRMQRLRDEWPVLRRRLSAVAISAAELQRRLAACGAPAHPAELGISLRALARDYRRVRLIRRRYTLLDGLDDLGWLDRAIDALFAPDGFWGRQAQRASVPPTDASGG